MTPFDQIFYPIVGTGMLIAFVVSYLAARWSGVLIAGSLLFIGTVVLWAALFIGSEIGYQRWQAMPNPPDEAFADTFPMGALLAGWIPAGFFCGSVFGCVYLFQYMRRKTK